MLLVTVLAASVCAALLGYALLRHSASARDNHSRRLALARAPGAAEVQGLGPQETALRGSRFGKDGPLTRALAGAASMRRLELQLERAGWRLSVTEFLMLSAGVALVIAVMASLASRPLAVPAGAIGLLLPAALLRSAVRRRRTRFVKQLVEALPLIANALKAGVSLYQALDRTAEQMPKPMSTELQRVLRDIRVGATPEDAFTALNERMQSKDLDLVVSAILVQRSTGGNLAEILDSLAHTMRERIRIRGEITTLTAQQRVSGYVLTALPIFLLAILAAVNRGYMVPLFTTTAGHITLAVAACSQLAAFFFVRRIVNIEV